MDNSDHILRHPTNQGILDFLRHIVHDWMDQPSCHPSAVQDPYYTLGTHPDLVELLWDKLTIKIPLDCRWVLLGRPVLVHPEKRIVFAFATGTHTYAFRIPTVLRQEGYAWQASQQYRYSGDRVLDLTQYDADWIFGGDIKDEVEVCFKAFESAGDSS
jgi:hypothetical protein